MFFGFKIFLIFLPLALLATGGVKDSISCGRVFDNIPGPFTFGNDYVDESGTKWGAGGSGTISIKSPNNELRVIRLETETDFRSIFVIDRQFGFAVGHKGNFFVTNGVIYATKDSGETWVEQKTGVKVELEAITCVDHLNCWAVGKDGVVLKTMNGGADWDVHRIDKKETLLAVAFVNHSTGWIAGKKGLVMKTVDGGTTWKEEKAATFSTNNYSEKHAIVWKGISFRDANLGCIAGYNRIVCTSDGGKSWNRTVFNDQKAVYNFINFAFYDDKIRVLEECAKDFISSDSGKTWCAIKQKEQ